MKKKINTHYFSLVIFVFIETNLKVVIFSSFLMNRRSLNDYTERCRHNTYNDNIQKDIEIPVTILLTSHIENMSVKVKILVIFLTKTEVRGKVLEI